MAEVLPPADKIFTKAVPISARPEPVWQSRMPSQSPEIPRRGFWRRGLGILVMVALIAMGVYINQSGAAATLKSALFEPSIVQDGEIVLRYGRDVEAQRVAEFTERLKRLGFTQILGERVPFDVTFPRVAFYRDADQTVAEALSTKIAANFGENVEKVAVRDYKHLIPDAGSGRLELWITE